VRSNQCKSHANLSMTDLSFIAQQFQFPAAVSEIVPYGAGIINDTYVVNFVNPSPGTNLRLGRRAILQRINGSVFPQPENVMHNLQRILQHAQLKIASSKQQQEFFLPPMYFTRDGHSSYRDAKGDYWRALGFIEQTASFDVLQGTGQAREVGVALGTFHQLVSDIPPDQLFDTLPGFHITPSYLASYDEVLANINPNDGKREDEVFCRKFIDEHRDLADVLVNADPPAVTRIMHGDPKLNNILFDAVSGRAVSIIDLDTVKPGLIQFDLGDCIRSCCNTGGEMPETIHTVKFEPEICRAILRGYLSAMSEVLQQRDIELIYDAICLLPFELGLRFFSDHLRGNRYFKVSAPDDNLYRARVQFHLLQHIERQEWLIRDIVQQEWVAAAS